MAGSGLILGNFIVGLLKGKNKKKKREAKSDSAQKADIKETRTQNVNYWKSQAARFEPKSDAKNYALSMVAFYNDTSGNM